MFTRKDYLENRCTHEQYYDQFVTPGVLNMVRQSIGQAKIKKSIDPHFNDIPLSAWDGLVPLLHTGAAMRELGDYPTLAGGVCVLKAAARQIKAQP